MNLFLSVANKPIELARLVLIVILGILLVIESLIFGATAWVFSKVAPSPDVEG